MSPDDLLLELVQKRLPEGAVRRCPAGFALDSGRGDYRVNGSLVLTQQYAWSRRVDLNAKREDAGRFWDRTKVARHCDIVLLLSATFAFLCLVIGQLSFQTVFASLQKPH